MRKRRTKMKYPVSIADQVKLILVSLYEESKTKEEILDVLKRLSIQFGASMFLHDAVEINTFFKLDQSLKFLLDENLITIDEMNVYSLTEKGIPEAKRFSFGMYHFLKFLNSFSHPSIAPILSLIFHIFLGSLKILIFFITGSVSILSDGLDSIMDGITAIVVGISMKIKKETGALYFILVLMIVAGLEITYEGFKQIIEPEKISDQFYIIVIALVSILLIGLLYYYQRYAGYKNKNLTILGQSFDSKNHVVNSVLVLFSTIIGSFGFYIVDGLVALFIGILILKSSYNLYLDIREQEGNELNFDKYKLGIWKNYDKTKSTMLDLWILNSLNEEHKSIVQLIESFNESFRPLALKYSGEKYLITNLLAINNSQNEGLLRLQLRNLIDENFISENNSILEITEKGKNYFLNESAKQSHKLRPFGTRESHFHRKNPYKN